ncbi:hypothetical protein DFH09DRAFT_1414215 [Mycena vulgaris]|nr:hypothetical protein DFH09DRAFT_1414215 [Mycena vulgaris]
MVLPPLARVNDPWHARPPRLSLRSFCLAPRALYSSAAAATTLHHVWRASSWVSVSTSGGTLNVSIRYDSRETVAIWYEQVERGRCRMTRGPDSEYTARRLPSQPCPNGAVQIMQRRNCAHLHAIPHLPPAAAYSLSPHAGLPPACDPLGRASALTRPRVLPAVCNILQTPPLLFLTGRIHDHLV